MAQASGEVTSAVLRFLDLEAEVDSDNDDGYETDGGKIDGFINDAGEDGADINHAAINLRRTEGSSNEPARSLLHDEYNDPFLDAQYDSLCSSAQDERNCASIEEIPQKQVTASPLWCIKCKKGCEYDVVLFIYGYTQCNPQQAATFPSIHCRQTGEGLVFLSTTNDTLAATVLRPCVFVQKSSSGFNGIDMTLLSIDESEASLIVPKNNPLLNPGTWVRLHNPYIRSWLKKREVEKPAVQVAAQVDKLSVKCKARTRSSTSTISEYHGDPAIIINADTDHVTVLFLPRIPTKHFLNAKLKPVLKSSQFQWLYQPDCFSDEFASKLRLRGFVFVNGLREETLPRCSVRPSSQPLSALEGQLFMSSKYPLVLLKFPQVDGWDFTLGERVEGMQPSVRGIVTEISDIGLVVSCEEGGGDHGVGWAARKIWRAGDPVRHDQRGVEGFVVVSYDDEHVTTFMGKIKSTNAGVTSEHDFEYEADSNLLQRIQTSSFDFTAIPHPVNQLQDPSRINLRSTGKPPWLNREVMVAGKVGEHRGRLARVVDVFVDQPTNSRLKVQLQTTVQGSNTPKFVVDYDCVVDVATGEPLHVIEQPANAAFRVPLSYRHPLQFKFKPKLVTPPRSKTPPAAISNENDDVAWCVGVNERAPTTSAPSPSQRAHHSQQWLYDLRTQPRVRNLHFAVLITGHDPFLNLDFKKVEKVVRFHSDQGGYSLQYQHSSFRTVQDSFILQPGHPNCRTTDPFFVLKGAYSGKCLVRVSNVGSKLFCHEIDVEMGLFDERVGYEVFTDQLCKLSMKKEAKDKLAAQRKEYREKHRDLYRSK